LLLVNVNQMVQLVTIVLIKLTMEIIFTL